MCRASRSCIMINKNGELLNRDDLWIYHLYDACIELYSGINSRDDIDAF